MTFVVGEVGDTIVPEPERRDHNPVPTVGVFPVKFTVVEQIV